MMNYSKYIYGLAIFFSLLLSIGSSAQSDDRESDHWSDIFRKDTSIHSLGDYFRSGITQGHLRNYYMGTINEGKLKDYHSNATGGALGYRTGIFYGVQLGARFSVAYNTGTNQIWDKDSITGKVASWETELFDVRRPKERNRLAMMEELFIKVHLGTHSFISYGKQDLNIEPLYLHRDGRMKPYLFSGFWGEMNEIKHTRIRLGWLDRASPRGMTDWFKMKSVIGLLNNGNAFNGAHADYYQAVTCNGIASVLTSHTFKDKWEINADYFYFDKLMHQTWFQAEWKKGMWQAGLQYVFQAAAKEQAALDVVNRFHQPGRTAQVISGKIRLASRDKEWLVGAAFLSSFGSEKFLFPRELGRENFYVSHARNWVDGVTKASWVMFEGAYKPKRIKGLKFETRIAHTQTVDDPRYNKYNLKPYWQNFTTIKYEFQHLLKGLDIHFMYITRWGKDQPGETLASHFYRKNYHNFNLVTNVYF